MISMIMIYSWWRKREAIENRLKYHWFQFPFQNYIIIIAKVPLLHLACLYCTIRSIFFVIPSSFDAVKQKQIFFLTVRCLSPLSRENVQTRGEKINSATRSPARLSTAVWRIPAYTLLEIQHSRTERPRTRSQFGHRCTRAHRRNLPASWTNKPFFHFRTAEINFQKNSMD